MNNKHFCQEGRLKKRPVLICLAYIHDSNKERTKRADSMTDRNIIDVLRVAEDVALDAVKGVTIKQLAISEDLLLNENSSLNSNTK